MSQNPTSPKVTVALAAGAVTTILVYIIHLATKVEVPAEVAAAITTVLMAAAAYLQRDPLRKGYEPKHDDNLRA